MEDGKNLPVPYKTQWDADAGGTANDCGPTSIAMITNYFDPSLKVTTDKVWQFSGAGLGLINIAQMQKAITTLGYKSEFRPNCSVSDLKAFIDRGMPVIALVHYGDLTSVQDTAYKFGHFFAVVGYRSDGYFVNDPNFKDKFRADGDHHFFTKAEFEKAWGDCAVDQNPNNSLIIIYPNHPVAPTTTSTFPFTPMTRNVAITPDIGANIRSAPNIQDKNIVSVLDKDASVPVDGYVIGEAVQENNIWWRLKGQQGFLWSGGTNFVPTIPTPPANPPAQPAQTQTTDNSVPSAPAADPADNPELLKLKLSALAQQLGEAEDANKKLAKDNGVLDTANKQLTTKLDSLDNRNLETIKEVNVELTKKNKLLTTQRDKAYIEAFRGWQLIEFPMGPSVVAKLKLIGQIVALNIKDKYVIGWKAGATLHTVDGEQEAINAADVTAEQLQ